MTSVSVPFETADDPCRQIDFVVACHAIRELYREGPRSVAELLPYLADTSEHIAQEAMLALKRLVPMAALEERWVDDRRPAFDVDPLLPPWITEYCQGWGGDDDFSLLCVREYLRLQQNRERQDRLLRRLTLFPGILRSFANELEKAGEADGRAIFLRYAAEMRRLQFPVQIGLSPTMSCQLHCEYCISAGNKQGAVVPVGEYDRFLRWAKEKGVLRIGLSGGEPTLYPEFAQLLKCIHEKGFEWYLATNGLIEEGPLQAIITGKPLAATLHLTPEVFHGKQLKDFTATAKMLVDAGINAVLRINFSKTDVDVAGYLDIAEQTGIREVRAAVPMPNASQQNAFIDRQRLIEYGAVLDTYVIEGRHRRLQTNLSKPFPPCMMAPETAQTFISNGSLAFNCAVHTVNYANNIVVTPELNFMPCLGLNFLSPHPITTYNSLAVVGTIFAQRIKELSLQPLLDTCLTCPLWHGGRCIGGCLSYRLNPLQLKGSA